MNELHVDSVTKEYDNRRILTDVHLNCRQGEIIALFGRNGSGKTTLMKIIYGSEPAPTKYVRINEHIIQKGNTKQLINYLPQQSCLPQQLKVETILKLWKKQSDIASLVKLRKVQELQGRKVKQLSWGEKRFLEIALFCHSIAPFILLDEPFNGLSPILISDIKGIIIAKSAEKGIIISDHDYQNVLDVATKLILINQGYTKPIKTKAELQELGYLP